MASKEHFVLLKQGVNVWNRWREENPEIRPDLSEADLIGASLYQANLHKANLYRANLSKANLYKADLIRANLHRANLRGANVIKANLRGADLTKADLSRTRFLETILASTNLTGTKGLDSCLHSGPSTIDHRTLLKSGQLPLEFLQGCGLPNTLIEYLSTLVNEPAQFDSCFISYSSKDQECAERLHTDLQNKGVRCWFAPEDLKIGDKFRVRIDESLRIYDKLLLILSEHSIMSDWVEQEVETALEKERAQKWTVLFPVRLDNAVMESKTGWAADVRRTRHIGEFRGWKDHNSYQKAFTRLLRDLKAADEKK